MATQDISVWDETQTNSVGVDSANHLYVSGKSAAGVAPSSNPVYIGGIDGGGLKRGILTDTSGRIQVSESSKFLPRFSTATNITITSQTVDTTFLTITDAGRIDSLIANFSTGKSELVLTVDGVEVLRLVAADVISGTIYNLDVSILSTHDIFLASSGSQWVIRWPSPVDFNSSVVLSARKTTTSALVMQGCIVKWRKRT